MNIVVIDGTLSRDPDVRALASGSTLLSCDVTVRDADQPTETVPIAWFDPPGATDHLRAGVEVVVTGRVRRRFFRSGGATIGRTEVVATCIEPRRRRRRCEAAVRSAIEPARDLGAGAPSTGGSG